MVHVLLNI